MKKYLKYIQLAMLVMVFSVMASCGNRNVNSTVTHVPVQMKVDGNWSLLDLETGAILFEGEFKEAPSIVTEGVFTTHNEKGEYYFHKIENEKSYKQIAGPFKSASLMNQGVAMVCKSESYISAIDKNGDELFTLEPQEGFVIKRVGQCFDGLIKIQDENDLWGFIDRSGKVVIKPQFDFVDDFVGGFARATIHTDDKNKIVIINKSGEIESEIENGYVGHVVNGMVAYSDEKDEFGVMTVGEKLEKKIKASSKFESINIQGDDIFYSSDNSWGLLNDKGEVVVRAKYESLTRLDAETLFGLKVDGDDLEFVILNNSGDELKKDELEDLGKGAFNLNSNGRILLKDGKEYELINSKGEKIGDNPVKNWDGAEDITRIKSNISMEIESDFFDWTQIENIIESARPGSFSNFTLGMNVIKANDQLIKFSSKNIDVQSENKNQGIGLVLSSYFFECNGVFGYFIGKGFEDNENSDSREHDTPDRIENGGTEDTQAMAIDTSEMSIQDNVPNWHAYQTSLQSTISLGQSGSVSVLLGFDDYIKKAVTKPSLVDYGYVTMMEEKIVGYDKNADAKLSWVQLEFSLREDKIEKFKTKLEKQFSKGFQKVSQNYGSKMYTDSKGGYWEVNGLRVKFYQPYLGSSVNAEALH